MLPQKLFQFIMQRVGTWLLRNSRISNHHENIFQKLSPWFYDLLDELWYPLSDEGCTIPLKMSSDYLNFSTNVEFTAKKMLTFLFFNFQFCVLFMFFWLSTETPTRLLRHPLSLMVQNDFSLTNNHTDLRIYIFWYKQVWGIFIQCEHQNIFLNYW